MTTAADRDVFRRARGAITRGFIESEFSAPDASWKGSEYWTRNPIRPDNAVGSFSINQDGRFHDFATGESGDCIDLIAQRDGIAPIEAARRLAGETPRETPRPAPQAAKTPPRATVRPIPEEALADLTRAAQATGIGKVQGEWLYQDAAGAPLFAVVRFEQPQGKTIRPLHWNGAAWQVGQPLERDRPLFNLPAILADPAAPILIVEGERCASVEVQSYIVTTWSGGAAAVDRTDWTPLRDREVVVWPDADEPGVKAANAILKHLPGARILNVSDRSGGWDLADAVQEGVDPAAFIAERVQEVVKAESTPTGFYFTRATDIELKPLTWLDPAIARGSLTVFYGQSGDGKTVDVLHRSATLSDQGSVCLYVAGEHRDGVVRRLRAEAEHHGLDIGNIFVSNGATALPDTESELIEAAAAVEKIAGRVDLLVLDTLQRNMVGNEDATADMAAFVKSVDRVRAAIDPDTAMVVIHHTGHDGSRARGNKSLYNSADVFWRIERGADELIRGTAEKSKEGDLKPFAFRIVGHDITINGESYSVPVCEPEGYLPPTPKGKAPRPQGINQETIVKAFIRALNERQERHKAAGKDSAPLSVHIDAVRDKAGLDRRLWDAGLKGLLKRGYFIELEGGMLTTFHTA